MLSNNNYNIYNHSTGFPMLPSFTYRYSHMSESWSEILLSLIELELRAIICKGALDWPSWLSAEGYVGVMLLVIISGVSKRNYLQCVIIIIHPVWTLDLSLLSSSIYH